ncbi:GmrSD restriction endonuclease domain-containing protein [Dermacoccaceae bacterium W4C1]
MFQRLEAEGADAERAYREDWPFETKFWTTEVSVGRNYVSRSSLFLNQWLTARIGEEVGPHSTFNRFKAFADHEAGTSMADLLPVIRAQAAQYEAWTVAANRSGGDLSRTELAVYRMNASGVELLKPLLIWLHDPGRGIPADVIDRVVATAESWVTRRQLMRLASGDLGRIIADVIRQHSLAEVQDLHERVVAHLSRLNVTSTYWPGDEEIRQNLRTEAAYRRFPRRRLRMFLEAAEDVYRAETRQPQVERAGYPIEHILPQQWRDNWPVATADEEEERQLRVHRLGNLTLLTASLNSKVSNGPWGVKRAALLNHNTINLTGRVVSQTEGAEWDEAHIDARTDEVIEAILNAWPVPAGHLGAVVDPQSKADEWIEVGHLVQAGVIEAGTVLRMNHGDFPDETAVVAQDGSLLVHGKRFTSPSGAGKHVLKRSCNGWYYWSLPDGRRLRDVKAEYLRSASADPAGH